MNTTTQSTQLEAGGLAWVILRLMAGGMAIALLVVVNSAIPGIASIALLLFPGLIAMSLWQSFRNGNAQKAAHYALLAIGMAKAPIFVMLFTSMQFVSTEVPEYGIAASFLLAVVYVGSAWACAEWQRVRALYAILAAEMLFILSPFVLVG